MDKFVGQGGYAGSVAGGETVDNDERLFRGIDFGDDEVDFCVFESFIVGRDGGRDWRREQRGRDLCADKICWELDVDGSGLQEALAKDAVNLAGGGVCRCQIRLRNGDFGGHFSEDAEIAIAKGVVHAGAAVLDGGWRCADDMDHGGHFGVCSAYGVDGRELADAEGGDDGPDSFDSRITVGRVTGVELIAVSHPFQASRGYIVECR